MIGGPECLTGDRGDPRLRQESDRGRESPVPASDVDDESRRVRKDGLEDEGVPGEVLLRHVPLRPRHDVREDLLRASVWGGTRGHPP